MAIDSREKRQSAFWAFHVRVVPSVTSDATQAAAWRQEVYWGYSGIAADAPAPTVPRRGFAGLVVSPGRLLTLRI